MSGVVCAIRGGPSSKPTVGRAISLAKEEDLPLFFLYVVNLDFLAYTESSRVRFISDEMESLGEFILLNAQSEAETQGVQVEGIVRHGEVMEEIIHLAQEVHAEYLVMGRPSGIENQDLFTQERFQSFVARIESESGARVVLPEEPES